MAERKKNTGLGKGLDALFGELGIGTEEKPSDNTAAAGGGAVEAVVTGALEVKALNISKDVVDPEDIDMLADLIMASVNEAIRKARDEKSATMDRISGGLNVPGLF